MSVCASTFQPSCQSVSPNPDLSSRWWFRMRDQSCRLGYGAVCVCVCVCVQSLCGFFFQRKPPFKTPCVPPVSTAHSWPCTRTVVLSRSTAGTTADTRGCFSLLYFCIQKTAVQHPFFLTQFKSTNLLAEIIQCTSIYVNWGHLVVLKVLLQSWFFPVA